MAQCRYCWRSDDDLIPKSRKSWHDDNCPDNPHRKITPKQLELEAFQGAYRVAKSKLHPSQKAALKTALVRIFGKTAINGL